jgi:hypothetical protein
MVVPHQRQQGFAARSGLLLGFAGLSAQQRQPATRLLGACLGNAAGR